MTERRMRFHEGRSPAPVAMASLLAVWMVASTGCAARSAPIAATGVADAQTAVRVKTALVNDPVLGTLPIDVGARGGVVTLSGTVPSVVEADLALALARATVGEARVESDLVVGDPTPSPNARRPRAAPGDLTAPARPGRSALAPPADDGPIRLVGLGASLRVNRPSETGLARTLAVGPLLRLRPRNGLGPTVAFNWTNAQIDAGPGGAPGLAAMQLRPVMGGVELGAVRGRFWAGASIVAGYSFNRLDVDTSRAGAGRAIAIGHSFVWRPGAAVWLDVTRRLGINVFGGYLFTNPEVTFASDTAIATERVAVNSAVVSVGVAYWIF